MFCDKCNEYMYGRTDCHCKEFEIIDEDGEEYSIYGFDEESAALNYAKKSNVNREYYLMDSEATIKVNGQEYSISAEPDIHYSVVEL